MSAGCRPVEGGVADCGGGPSVFLIADDLTGAADSGVTFAKHGAQVLVAWEAGHGFEADVVVISTESRHGSADEAATRVAATMASMAERVHSPNPPWIYKKIDSTLRGHPGVELAAVLRYAGAMPQGRDPQSGSDLPRALVAPAFPAQGRVTRSGDHYVHGVPLAETVFGSSVTTSRVRDVFLRGFDPEMVAEIPLADVRAASPGIDLKATAAAAGARVLIADAVTETDLARLAGAALKSEFRILCGSAGLADALAAYLAPLCRWTHASEAGDRATTVCSAVLVVAASRHPQTRRQVEALRAGGIPVLTPSVEWIRDGISGDVGIAARLTDALGAGAGVLTTVGLPDLSVSGAMLVSRLAEVVVAHCLSKQARDSRPSPTSGAGAGRAEPLGLVVTGGDAAIAVSRALGARALQLHGEVTTGMPWGRLSGGLGDGMPVVTKAGGFGDDRALLEAINFLRGTSDD